MQSDEPHQLGSCQRLDLKDVPGACDQDLHLCKAARSFDPCVAIAALLQCWFVKGCKQDVCSGQVASRLEDNQIVCVLPQQVTLVRFQSHQQCLRTVLTP